MFQVAFDPSEGAVPTLEVLARMRDQIVEAVRSGLLTGLFQDRPDDLQVSGHVTNDVIEISVKDSANTDEFTQKLPLQEFLGAKNYPESAKPAHDREETQDNLFTPRVELTPRTSLAKFKNEQRADDIRRTVSEIAQGRINTFVSEYLKLKA